MSDYTTIALTDADKHRLDELAEQHFEDNASYRQIVNFLADEFEQQESQYERVLARAIADANEDDVMSAIKRVERDKAFVQEVNEQ